jgi:hypothetical protein
MLINADALAVSAHDKACCGGSIAFYRKHAMTWSRADSLRRDWSRLKALMLLKTTPLSIQSSTPPVVLAGIAENVHKL